LSPQKLPLNGSKPQYPAGMICVVDLFLLLEGCTFPLCGTQTFCTWAVALQLLFGCASYFVKK
jgi:hypothetical protein